jgi:hypothetical protein
VPLKKPGRVLSKGKLRPKSGLVKFKITPCNNIVKTYLLLVGTLVKLKKCFTKNNLDNYFCAFWEIKITLGQGLGPFRVLNLPIIFIFLINENIFLV